jgi:hypothetical protein
MYLIPCQYGHIFPHGGDILAASTDKAGRIARRLKALPGVKVHQDGDDGATVLFHVNQFDTVADIIQPRRRRRLSPEARKAAGERLAKFQFRPAVEVHNEAQFCVGRGQDELLPTPAPQGPLSPPHSQFQVQ